ncbi:MAG: hypothetical protein U5L74_01000 [Ideonella sp.]|nr:hypothetical protein [Ideonella sp.]
MTALAVPAAAGAGAVRKSAAPHGGNNKTTASPDLRKALFHYCNLRRTPDRPRCRCGGSAAADAGKCGFVFAVSGGFIEPLSEAAKTAIEDTGILLLHAPLSNGGMPLDRSRRLRGWYPSWSAQAPPKRTR